MEKKIIDPRIKSIEIMLGQVKRVLPVISLKGGVGKTTLSVLLSIALGENGVSVGLLDLDLNNPGTHHILGINPKEIGIIEEKGVKPHKISDLNINYATITMYTHDKPGMLRGLERLEATLELLAITNWGLLDYLVIDTGPGMGDEVLGLLKLLKEPEPLIVTTPSLLSQKSTEKLLDFLLNEGITRYKVIVNMHRGEPLNDFVTHVLPYEIELEKQRYSIDRIRRTPFYREIKKLAFSLLHGKH